MERESDSQAVIAYFSKRRVFTPGPGYDQVGSLLTLVEKVVQGSNGRLELMMEEGALPFSPELLRGDDGYGWQPGISHENIAEVMQSYRDPIERLTDKYLPRFIGKRVSLSEVKVRMSEHKPIETSFTSKAGAVDLILKPYHPVKLLLNRLYELAYKPRTRYVFNEGIIIEEKIHGARITDPFEPNKTSVSRIEVYRQELLADLLGIDKHQANYKYSIPDLFPTSLKPAIAPQDFPLPSTDDQKLVLRAVKERLRKRKSQVTDLVTLLASQEPALADHITRQLERLRNTHRKALRS